MSCPYPGETTLGFAPGAHKCADEVPLLYQAGVPRDVLHPLPDTRLLERNVCIDTTAGGGNAALPAVNA